VLYLDSSALVKAYVHERGSISLANRMEQGDRILTSKLTFAEIHAAFARKHRERAIATREFRVLRHNFLNDWLFRIEKLPVDSNTMTSIPDLVRDYSLKGADAVHLSTAIWLRDTIKIKPTFAQGDLILEFAASDKDLARVASRCRLAVFDPEAAD
jgi:uncharacterized protein